MTYVEVFKRACVSCTAIPSCPVCASDEECILTTQTCSSCPRTYCSALTNLGSSGARTRTRIGAITGGVLGGVLVLSLIAAIIFFKYYWVPRKRQYNKEIDEEFKYVADEDNVIHSIAPDDSDKRLSQVTLSTMAMSVFTKASNVIPIAYIPGVTVKYNQQHNKTATPSIYSDIDEASIIGHEPLNTTTAYKVKPRLVNFDGDTSNDDNIPRTAISIVNLGGVKTVKVGQGKRSKHGAKYEPTLQRELILEEEDDEGDSLFDLNIELEDKSNTALISPFHNNNAIIEDSSDDDDDEGRKHSIEGLSDDDDYDPEIMESHKRKTSQLTHQDGSI